jgi:hypothetical protein
MNLRYIAVLLGILVYAAPVNAMEVKDDSSKPVTLRMWKSSDVVPNGHISLETDKYYMNLHLYSRVTSLYKNQPDSTSRSYASVKFERDIELLFGKPQVTYVLYLNTQPMNTMWEKLTDGAQEVLMTFGPTNLIGHVLPKVRYYGAPMADTKPSWKDWEEGTLYLSNMTLIKGLLYTGGMKDTQRSERFFQSLPKLPSLSVFNDIIANNKLIANQTVTLDEVEQLIMPRIQEEVLLTIEEEIKKREMTYLTTNHDKEIVRRVQHQEQDFQTICAHLDALETEYKSDQSYVSPTGWVNWWNGKWKTTK